jgi:hypothetical protein
MNEREEFLQYFKSVFTNMVERMETMTETQVLDGLREVKAARNIYEEEFAERMEAMIQTEVRERPRRVVKAARNIGEALAYLRSIQPFFNSVNKLRSQLGAKARSGGSPRCLFDSLEDALKNRLETLRKRPSSGS